MLGGGIAGLKSGIIGFGGKKEGIRQATKNIIKTEQKVKINITKIESRPSKKELGKYIFWMDINGHIKDQKLKNIFDQVKQMTSMLKIIGSYPEATNII